MSSRQAFKKERAKNPTVKERCLHCNVAMEKSELATHACAGINPAPRPVNPPTSNGNGTGTGYTTPPTYTGNTSIGGLNTGGYVYGDLQGSQNAAQSAPRGGGVVKGRATGGLRRQSSHSLFAQYNNTNMQ